MSSRHFDAFSLRFALGIGRMHVYRHGQAISPVKKKLPKLDFFPRFSARKMHEKIAFLEGAPRTKVVEHNKLGWNKHSPRPSAIAVQL